jgi:hypothetical protein
VSHGYRWLDYLEIDEEVERERKHPSCTARSRRRSESRSCGRSDCRWSRRRTESQDGCARRR